MFAKIRNTRIKRKRISSSLCVSEVLRDVVQKVFEKIVDNLDFVENINYIRESSETAVHGFSGINLHENTSAGVLLQ